jgi:hypothetical protein
MGKNIDDDFEFRPLTEGLGFHKKTINLRDDNVLNETIQTPTPARQNTKAQSIHPSSEPGDRPSWTPQLKNKEFVIAPQSRPQTKPLTQTQSQSPARTQTLTQTHSQTNTQTQAPTQTRTYAQKFIDTPVSWPAALFDGAMILGLGLLFSAVVFALTKIDLTDLLTMLRDETGAQIASLVLMIAVFEIYCVTCRSFFGKTLGEWAFDCRLGLPQEQLKTVYPLQVAWRTLVIALTGFIVLPVVSSFMNKDIAGMISGVFLKQESR